MTPNDKQIDLQPGELADQSGDDGTWDDLLGTGTVLKKVLIAGRPPDEDEDGFKMETPRKFFALIDIETRLNGQPLPGESYKNYLLNVDADLFPGAHLVIPLMDVGETSLYIFDAKFGYGECGNQESDIPPNAKLECKITLKLRPPIYDEFLEQLTAKERIPLARRKRERGKFWFSRGQLSNAVTVYESLTELCNPVQAKE